MPMTSCKLKGNRCKCPSCGECFSSVHGFDKHRKGAHGVDRHCVNPKEAGLSIREGANGTYWTTPMDGAAIWGKTA